MKRKRCVLFQWTVPDHNTGSVGMLIEQLRYAGLVKVVKETDNENGRAFVLEINAPKGYDDRAWAHQNVNRMKSFGINAVDTFAS